MKINLKKFLFLFIFIFLFAAASFGQTGDAAKSSEKPKKESSKKEDKPIRIKTKPPVEFRPGDCSQLPGNAVLRVTFDKSAKVTNIVVRESSGCEIFDKRAVNAAKKIKFKPAVKNGEPITVTKSVVYSFQMY